MPKKKKILTLDEHFEFVRMLLPLARKMREAEHAFWKLAYDMEDKWLADGISQKEIDSIIHDAEYCAEKDVLEGYDPAEEEE